jgi:hypothetical protein
MKVRYSRNNEISIEGSIDKLAKFHQDILDFVRSEKIEFVTVLNFSFNPAPYESAAINIIFRIADENSVYIDGKSLFFTGAKEFFSDFAHNIPFDVDTIPYHVHYDYISFPEFLNETSPDLVIEATA